MRGVSVQGEGGHCPGGGGLCLGVSVEVGLCPGGLCPGGLCLGGSLSRVRGSLYRVRGSLSRGSLSGRPLDRDPPIR